MSTPPLTIQEPVNDGNSRTVPRPAHGPAPAEGGSLQHPLNQQSRVPRGLGSRWERPDIMEATDYSPYDR